MLVLPASRPRPRSERCRQYGAHCCLLPRCYRPVERTRKAEVSLPHKPIAVGTLFHSLKSIPESRSGRHRCIDGSMTPLTRCRVLVLQPSEHLHAPIGMGSLQGAHVLRSLVHFLFSLDIFFLTHNPNTKHSTNKREPEFDPC